MKTVRDLIKDNSWKPILFNYLDANREIENSILNVIINMEDIYPSQENIFRCFELTSLDELKVVLIGQDPYHNGNADGLAFSSSTDYIPPSLKNIFGALKNDLDIVAKTGSLVKWAEQGILLLNTALTVRKGEAGSHIFAWSHLIEYIIKEVSETKDKIVFILWGRHANSYKESIDQSKHMIVSGPHPSPMCRENFRDGKYFSKTNNFLKENNINEIDWEL